MFKEKATQMEKINELFRRNENKILLLLILSNIVFYGIYFFEILSSGSQKIVVESDFDYSVFTMSRVIFEMPLAILIVAFFKSNNYRHYLIACLILAIFPTQHLYVFIQEMISNISNKFFSEQYIRAFVTLFSVLGLLIIYLKEKTLKTFFLFAFSTAYIFITLFSHIALIEGWWNTNFQNRLSNMEIIQKEKDTEMVVKMCQILKLNCVNEKGEQLATNGYELSNWQLKNLNTILENKEKLRSFYFFNNILTFTNEIPFIKKDISYEEGAYTSIAIKILFAKNVNNILIADTQVTKEINSLRFYYGIFNFFAGLVWLLGSILLLKVHKNKMHKKIWFK